MPPTPSVVTSIPFESRYFTIFRFASMSCSRVWPCHGLMGERILMECLPFAPTTSSTAYVVVVHLNLDVLAPARPDAEVRRDHDVSRKPRDYVPAVADLRKLRIVFIAFKSTDAPQRYGALHERVPRRAGRLAIGDCIWPCGVVEDGQMPAGDVAPRVEADVRLRQPVVRMRLARVAVGRMAEQLPCGVGRHAPPVRVHAEEESGPPAAVVREAVLAPVPDERGDRVDALLEERREVYLVVIRVARIRPAFADNRKAHVVAAKQENTLAMICHLLIRPLLSTPRTKEPWFFNSML